MLTKSIRLTEEEAADLREYLSVTGEVEAAVLKRAALRGLKELRLEQAILMYLEREDSVEAARIAGMTRAEFLQVLIDKGITVLRGPSTLAVELEVLARQFGNEKLAAGQVAFGFLEDVGGDVQVDLIAETQAEQVAGAARGRDGGCNEDATVDKDLMEWDPPGRCHTSL